MAWWSSFRDFATHKPVATLKGHKGPVLGISFLADGSTFATGSGWGDDGGAWIIWSLTNGVYQLLLNLGKADSLCSSPDGKTLVTSREAEIRLWDATTWKLRNTLKGHIGPISGMSFLTDGHSLVTCGIDRTVRLWQWPADDPSNTVSRIIGAHLDSISSLAVSRD